MEITQAQVTALEAWIEYKKDAYLQKGLTLAAQDGIEALSDFKSGDTIAEKDAEKSLAELKKEYDLAVEFHKDARQLLYAGRQGG